MKLTRNQVLARFCALSSFVAVKKYAWKEPADCFCYAGKHLHFDYQFSSEIMKFIEVAVYDALGKYPETDNQDNP